MSSLFYTRDQETNIIKEEYRGEVIKDKLIEMGLFNTPMECTWCGTSGMERYEGPKSPASLIRPETDVFEEFWDTERVLTYDTGEFSIRIRMQFQALSIRRLR